jgi:PPP family 3-phenylpropionic acid transporter
VGAIREGGRRGTTLTGRGSARATRRSVGVAYFLVYLGGGVSLPYFPLYLTHLGYTGWQVGAVTGLQPVLRWIAAIVWAYAADRWRMRHGLLVATALAGGSCFVPLLVVRNFSAMLAVTAAIALFHGPVIPMVDATVMDHLDGLGGDYGRLRLWGSIAFVVGALGSAPLVHLASPGVVPLLMLVPSVLLPPALWRLPRGQLGHVAQYRPPWRLLTPPLALFLASAFLLNMSCGAWQGFFALHTAALGLSDTVPGMAWGVAVLAEIVLFFWARQLLERVAPATLVLVVVAGTAARWLFTALAHTEALVVALQLGHTLTFSAFHLAALLLLNRLVPVESSTTGQALYGLVAMGLGGSAGMWAAGALVDRVGTAGVFGAEAAVALLAFGPAVRLWRTQ